MIKKHFLISLFILTALAACNESKTIEAVTTSEDAVPPGACEKCPLPENGSNENSLHTVNVLESLSTEMYSYIRVEENSEEFWIATKKTDVKVNAIYYYRGGLLKTDYENKELNRKFEKIYLVSSIVPMNHGQSASPTNETYQTKNIDMHGGREELTADIKIADILASPEKFQGTTVRLVGKCTKINSGIMNRNWIHLIDGSRDDYDFVLTSQDHIPVGHTFAVSGTIILDKDFGAGYRYDIIMENSVIEK